MKKMAEAVVTSSPIKHENMRKNKKPLMEKKRRARINGSLNQLKALVLHAVKKDSSQFSKLEKADILEMTVKHLRSLQRQHASGVMTQDTQVVSKYRAGFSQCAQEVCRYIGSVHEVKDEVKQRLLGHLADCLQTMNPVSQAGPVPLQQVHPLLLHVPPQQTVGAGVFVIPAPASQPPSQLQGGLIFRPSAERASSQDSCRSPSMSETPGSPLSLHRLPAVTTASAEAAGSSGAVHVGSRASRAVYVTGSSLHQPRAMDTVSATPRCALSLPAQSQGIITTSITFPTSPLNTSALGAPSSPEWSAGPAGRLEISPATLPVDLRRTSGTHVGSCRSTSPLSQCDSTPCSSASSAADDRLWRPW